MHSASLDTDSLTGSQLIFLITQPRSGSTLLQRILGAHSSIHTLSEPWLMLHPVYALRDSGFEAEYDEHLSRIALRSYLSSIPGGETVYIEGIRKMYTHLYRNALRGAGASHFLDKTPRYYFIIDELYRIFPDAKYVILLRNPVSILASYLSLESKHLLDLNYNRHDLFRAPDCLIRGIKLLGRDNPIIHYEDLVSNPEATIQSVCEHINIPFESEMIEYNDSEQPRWKLGDPENVYKRSRPTTENVEKWLRLSDDPQYWRLFRDYLSMLGPERFAALGYVYEDLREKLEGKRPSWFSLLPTVSLDWLINRQRTPPRWWERTSLRAMRWLQ